MTASALLEVLADYLQATTAEAEAAAAEQRERQAAEDEAAAERIREIRQLHPGVGLPD